MGPSHTELTSLLSRASEWFVSWETVRAAHGIAFARPEWRLALSQSHTPLRSHVLQDRRLNFVFPSLREKLTRRHLDGSSSGETELAILRNGWARMA